MCTWRIEGASQLYTSAVRLVPLFRCSEGFQSSQKNSLAWSEKSRIFTFWVWEARSNDWTPIIIRLLLALAFLVNQIWQNQKLHLFWQISKETKTLPHQLHKNLHLYFDLSCSAYMPACGKYNPGQSPLVTIFETSLPVCMVIHATPMIKLII